MEGRSQIVDFFNGKHVLVTGATGFLGKMLVEKLLRCCPDVVIYVLVRGKKGEDFMGRWRKTLEEPVFGLLGEGFQDKIRVCQGDISLENLGLTDEDRKMLVGNVEIIIHSAAITKFTEEIRVSTLCNVGGTLEVLKLAKLCPKLQVFTYIGTAYSNCVRSEIGEKFYDPPVTPEELLKVEDQFVDLCGWPNTYTFTKAVAENLIERYSQELPICIVRPSSVVSTFKEPIKGWTDNLYGAIGIMASGSSNFIKIIYADPRIKAEIIPVDYLANATLAATFKRFKDGRTKIYNFVASKTKFWRIEEFLVVSREQHFRAVGYKPLICQIFYTQNLFIFTILSMIFHRLPGKIFDFSLWVFGEKFRLSKMYEKVEFFWRTLFEFTSRNWNWSNDNVVLLWNSLSHYDQNLFPFDVEDVDPHILGLLMEEGLHKFIYKKDPRNLKKLYIIYDFIIILLLLFFICCLIINC